MPRPIDRTSRILFAVFVFGLAAAPFWFGSNTETAWAINAVFYGALLVAYELSLLIRGKPHPVGLKAIWAPALAVALVLIWIFLQWSSWTPQGWHHPLWDLASATLGERLAGSISVAPEHTAFAALRLLTATAVFWLAMQLCRSGRRASLLMTAIAIIGIAYAVYGIISFVFFPDYILWIPKLYYKDSVTSTFINRNSYATYAGLTLLACFGTLVTIYGRASERVSSLRRYRIGSLIRTTAGAGGLMMLGFFVVAIALMLTGSRAGIGSSLVGFITLCGLLLVGRRRGGSVAPIIVLAVLAAVAATFSLYGDLFFQRLGDVNNATGSRLAVYRLTLKSISDSPLLGMGYGTFEDIFPLYRDTTMDPRGVWDKAHNTYLEVFQGLGIPAGVLFVGAILLLVRWCFRGAFTRRWDGILPSVPAAGSVLVGMHALVDFSLQMQAVALTWIALLGMGVAQSWSSQRMLQDRAEPDNVASAGPRVRLRVNS